MKRYPEYKPSGVSWIGNVPEHWEMKRLRAILSPVSDRNRPDLPLLSVVREKGVIVRNINDDKENHNYIPDDLSNYKVVRQGQFAMNKMKAWQGSFGISKHDGIVSPAYFVFNLNNVTPAFFHTASRSKAYVPFFTSASDGIRVGQWDLNQTRMKEIPFWIPKVEEQTQIVRYLDWKTSQIARFIKSKKRMIDLLKEQKQVIINDAVTGKIDVLTGKPYPRYKETGVEWLGIVPYRWMVLPIRRLTNLVKTGSTPKGVEEKYFEEEGFNWYTPGDLNDELYLKKAQRNLSGLGIEMVNIFQPNSVLMVGIGATIGKTAIITLEASCNQQINALVVNNKIISEYLVFCIRMMKHFIISCGKYTTLPIINQDETKMLEIPVPSLNEQRKIVDFVKNQLASIQIIISQTEHEIDLMQEYRTSLISDVVTGKVDVRTVVVPEDIANSFPEEEIIAEDTIEPDNDNHVESMDD